MNVGTSQITDEHRTSALLDDELAMLLGAQRARVWRLPRTGYRPEIRIARGDDGGLRAAVFTSARPSTAATKIVDLWWRDEASRAVAADLVDGVVRDAAARGDLAVKWQVLPGGDPVAALALELGFRELRRPWAALGTGDTRGFVRWLAPTDHTEPGYYAQTTLFTCGAVAALIAADGLGRSGFAGAEQRQADGDLEVGFWRRASNYPACEPVGLAVALREYVEAPVEVALDLDGPALLEEYAGFDREFRAELQEQSARQASALGIPRRRDRVSVEEISARVGNGRFALLLIDEAPMHGEVGPHWIVAHATVGGAVLVQDPWINVEEGETWVDTHELPVLPDQLDRLVRWAEPDYRGVIFAG